MTKTTIPDSAPFLNQPQKVLPDAKPTRLVKMVDAATPSMRMFNAAADAGLTFRITYDDELDYEGTNPVDAWQALLDCTEPMHIRLFKGDKQVAWALVIPENGEDDLCDHGVGDWIDKWAGKNLPW